MPAASMLLRGCRMETEKGEKAPHTPASTSRAYRLSLAKQHRKPPRLEEERGFLSARAAARPSGVG